MMRHGARSLAIACMILASCGRFASSTFTEDASTEQPAEEAGVAVESPSNDDTIAIDAGDEELPLPNEDAAVMGCMSFVDRTSPDASRSLTWDFTFPLTKERCLEIRVGQSVSFTNGANEPARFDIHSVQAGDGTQPNPIGTQLDLQTGVVTFPSAGTFGFLCVDHRTMRGAIRAVP